MSNTRYKAVERYSTAWTGPHPSPTASWTHEHCECCQRDTPHREGLCIYDGMPSRETCALYSQRFQEFRRDPRIEYRPFDDRYVRIA